MAVPRVGLLPAYGARSESKAGYGALSRAHLVADRIAYYVPTQKELMVPKPNYAFAKRQRDLAKKQKKEAKRQKKAEAAQAMIEPSATNEKAAEMDAKGQ